MRRRGVAEALIAAALFGVTTPATSALAGDLSSFTLAGLLYLGAAIGVVPALRSDPLRLDALVADWQLTTTAVVAGGMVGPVLLMAGLARTSAASASLLLNTELVFTVIIAAWLFRDRVDLRLGVAVAMVTLAGVWLVWQPGATVDGGALLIVAACMFWGLDNNVTARIERLSAAQVVALKGLVAGAANLLIGIASTGWSPELGMADVGAALLIGAVGYGVSITLWVKGARQIGAPRAQVLFATAPFIGTAAAWIVLREPVQARQVGAFAIVAGGIVAAMSSMSSTVDPADAELVHLHHHALLIHRHPHLPDHRHGPERSR